MSMASILGITSSPTANHYSNYSLLFKLHGLDRRSSVRVRLDAHKPPRLAGSIHHPTMLIPGKFVKILYEWSTFASSTRGIFSTTERRDIHLTRSITEANDINGLTSEFGRDEGNGVFSRTILIRSYEIGANGTASMDCVMQHLQDTLVNRLKSSGYTLEGFSTPQMKKRNLVWVAIINQVVVDRYPKFGELIRIRTWSRAQGMGIRHEWHIMCSETNETLIRATSKYLLMNTQTRKFSKFGNEIRKEFEIFFMDSPASILEVDKRIVLDNLETAAWDYVRCGLKPGFFDLDETQHVNNAKYIVWIFESIPEWVVEIYELAAVTLEYRKECGRESVLESLSAATNINADGDKATQQQQQLEFIHLLRLENGPEVVRGRTTWKPKFVQE